MNSKFRHVKLRFVFTGKGQAEEKTANETNQNRC